MGSQVRFTRGLASCEIYKYGVRSARWRDRLSGSVVEELRKVLKEHGLVEVLSEAARIELVLDVTAASPS